MLRLYPFRALARAFAFSALLLCASVSLAQSVERIDLWPDLAPGETVREPDVVAEGNPDKPAQRVTTPYLLVSKPEKQTKDVAILIFPGGGFNVCFYHNEGEDIAKYWNERGYLTAVLVYRVPRPDNAPIYSRALQDAQRAVRIIRANAEKYGVSPERIGAQGFSAGSCLCLLTAVNSETVTYQPLDDLDKLPANLAFAIPVYPAYVLDDGARDPNANKGLDAAILPDFHFDDHTPPMCLIHGDADIYSPLGSVEVYKRLRKMNIPAEIHIFSGAPHGFMFWDDKVNANTWLDRCSAWLETIGF
ncbi:MAG: alpha/beta hydrolase [Planctomycetia bacterium]|nr:alpha/beta hydrolase [Planctomycetia bacterium]